MAGEENFFSKAWNAITGLVSSVARSEAAKKLKEVVTQRVSKTFASRIGQEALGFGAGTIVNLYASWREYKQAENEMRLFFAPEIAAKLGKDPKKVTVDDLYEAAKTNPTIAEDISRNKKARNLNFGINTVSLLIAVFATAAVIAHIPILATAGISLAGMGAFAVSAAIGLGMFLAVEKPLEILGKKLFGLSEPSVNAAVRNLNKQGRLSLPSQIRALDRLQKQNAPITADHVMTAFLAADQDLNSHIIQNYGKRYAQLSPETRARIIAEIGPNYRIEAIANDLASRQMRAQEMAFMVHGQTSGMKLPEPKEAAPGAVASAVVEVDTPAFSYRTKIIEERKQAQKAPEMQEASGPAQQTVTADRNPAYRTLIIEERKAAAQPQQTSLA